MPAFFATAPKGLEYLLVDELKALGGENVREALAGVHFDGELAVAYRACLWSRLANRILMPIAEFPSPTPEDLYAGVQGIDWSRHLAAEGSLAVDFSVSQSAITHDKFGAQKVKDAVVDQFRERVGVRPSVDTDRPDVRINVYVRRDKAVVAIDLSGTSLHQRGYRLEAGAAPLKENLAAALLLRAGWPAIASAGGALLDPMCGSGTIVIEAALMAADIAPGLTREYFGFHGWLGHDRDVWDSLVAEAKQRREAGLAKGLPPIAASDRSHRMVDIVEANAERAGVADCIRVMVADVADVEWSERPERGLILTNPPYGERLGEREEVEHLYGKLGITLKRFVGWHAGVFTGDAELGQKLGIRAKKRYALYNGALPCVLLVLEILPENFRVERDPNQVVALDEDRLSDGARSFRNRLQKNHKKLASWAAREGIDCYRVYDADLPEYAAAIDVYGDYLHIQEYAAPTSVDPKKADERWREIVLVAPATLGVPPARAALKVRQRQKGEQQYEKLDARRDGFLVHEYGLKFEVNLFDYLDTGLFLDHRLTRKMTGEMAKGARFLNLFAYTGTATVHAARGGARSTMTVDMSKTYLDWARRNMNRNGFDGAAHRYVQQDCLAFLDGCQEQFDLIFLDPPTFSNSKRMSGTFDVQRDHVLLIDKVMRLLAPGGTLVFSNNNRRFKIDEEALSGCNLRSVNRETLPVSTLAPGGLREREG